MTAVCFSRFSSNFLKKTFSRSIHLKYISSKVVCREDTIFALSSGHGKAGVAVIRVSGPSARDAILRLSAVNKLPPPQQATIRNIVDPNTQEPIDRGLVLWFPGPRSFTGEDTAELHIHGGIAVVTALLTALGKLPGLRHAEAGEFTKRAFINGKLDLTEVEGLADLVNAETEAQRKQALRQLSGELSKLYTDWRHRLIKCLANVEAFIDFHEEENIEDDVLDHVEVEIKNLLSEISAHLGDGRRGERLRSGIHVVIIGPPNVGKSSLLNRLCQRPAAIVSPTAGTTRDVIETAINLAGFPVLISDTAGLREAEGDVEREGIKRAMSRALNSDIKVIMLDAPAILTKHENKKSDLQEIVISHLSELGFLVELIDEQNTAVAATDTEKSENQNKKLLDKNHNMYPPHHIDDIQKKPILPANRRSHSKHENCFKQVSYDDLKMETVRSPFQNLDKSADIQNSETGNEADKISLKADDIIIVFNKCDLLKDFRETEERTNGFEVMWVSCITQQGIPQFVDVLTEKVKQMCWDPLTGDVNLTQTRHRSHLTHCVRHLQSYQLLLDSDIVIASQQLRKAVREIGKVIGKVSSEDILNVIFSDFCIGK